MIFGKDKTRMPGAADTLPGRDQPANRFLVYLPARLAALRLAISRDPLAGFELQRDTVEQRDVAEGEMGASDGKQGHGIRSAGKMGGSQALQGIPVRRRARGEDGRPGDPGRQRRDLGEGVRR